MALNMTETIARLTLAVSLSAILASCSSVQGPSAFAVLTDVEARDRGTKDQSLIGNGNGVSAATRVYVDESQIEPDAPDSYTVVSGDTLWDISDRFLKEPWRWSEIWGYNRQIYNPHLIYPGDVLSLVYVNGRPTLSLTREGATIPHNLSEPGLGAANPQTLDADGNVVAGNSGRVKLSPRIRSESLDAAIPTIAGDAISQFLVQPRVVDQATLDAAPYVIANNEERLISSLGSKIYVRGRMNRDQTSYGVFRKNKSLIDPVNGAHLGYEVTHVSDAKLLNIGDPSTLGLISNKMETISGDILLPHDSSDAVHMYVPRMPELRGEARIVSLVNAISRTGRDQVVVLNVGSESNIEQGDVLAVETRGTKMVDKRGANTWQRVQLPNQRTGVLMVFKTFDKVSYALVMESIRPLRVNDIVTGI